MINLMYTLVSKLHTRQTNCTLVIKLHTHVKPNVHTRDKTTYI